MIAEWQVKKGDFLNMNVVLGQPAHSSQGLPPAAEQEQDSDDASEGSDAEPAREAGDVLFDFDWGIPNDGKEAGEGEDAPVTIYGQPLVESSDREEGYHDDDDFGDPDDHHQSPKTLGELREQLKRSNRYNKRLSEMLIDARDELVR